MSKQRIFLWFLALSVAGIAGLNTWLAGHYAQESLAAMFLWSFVLFVLTFFRQVSFLVYLLRLIWVGAGLALMWWHTIDLLIDFRSMAKAYEMTDFPILGIALVPAGVWALMFIPFWALIWSDWRNVRSASPEND